jgi:hypothetical protein
MNFTPTAAARGFYSQNVACLQVKGDFTGELTGLTIADVAVAAGLTGFAAI